MKLTVLSVNIQNYYGDKDSRTYARQGHNQSHILADEIVAQAMYYGANVICTQEDEHGLAIPGNEEVGAACLGNDRQKEVVRTYVQVEMAGKCKHTVVIVPWSEACPLPARCALIVQLPSGHRVANVFLAGGRMDDRNFAWYGGCADVRTEYIDRVIAHAPDILVGDWNADINAQREEELYKLDSEYVTGIFRGMDDMDGLLKRWLHWRQTPFLRLKENGYDFQWPEETTAGRGALAVDGFAYNAATCKPKGAHSQAIRFMQHFTDHSGVVATFSMEPVERDVPADFELSLIHI